MKFASILSHLPHKTAYAHCDIPCGIYDPHASQMAAHTIIRMTQFLEEIKRDNETKVEHDSARVTHIKEEHGQLVEEELETLQNDYFKEEHYKAHKNLKDLLAKGVSLSVKTRQSIDMKAAGELLEIVMQIAEIFYKTKNVPSKRVKSTYPTELDIVVPA